jgi:hypothetical protein
MKVKNNMQQRKEEQQSKELFSKIFKKYTSGLGLLYSG